jgi:hypothetical protein
MRRKRTDTTPADKTPFGKAFKASGELLEAESRLAKDELSSATRTRLNKTVRDQTDKLENLTERDRLMTRLLAQYRRQYPGEMESYRHFHEWCTNQGELNDLDPRTIQYRLQNHYNAQGRRGRPAK